MDVADISCWLVRDAISRLHDFENHVLRDLMWPTEQDESQSYVTSLPMHKESMTYKIETPAHTLTCIRTNIEEQNSNQCREHSNGVASLHM